jgi:nitrile hydratase
MSVYGPVPALETLLVWEQQCHSLLILLSAKKIFITDEFRRSIESLTPEQYNEWSYYEKWSAGMTNLLLEKKILTPDELEKALWGEATPDDTTICFKVGDSVRVKRYHDAPNEWKRPHIRTPGYVYGVVGTIERICGRHGDPSYLAFGLQTPPLRQLYRVRFRMQDLWPEQYDGGGEGGGDDHNVVEVEVYDHWLEPADTSTGHDFEDRVLFDHKGGADDCLQHAHDHHHGDDDDSHVHEERPIVEERAIQREGPPRPGQELFQALLRLLIDKDIVSSSELRIMAERMDTAGKHLDGATLVVNAWLDPSFQERLLADPAAAAGELGIVTANPNAPTVLTVVANTPTTHNLVVCTLCSCYPAGLLGIAPSWYKSREYRARAVREPKSVLTEFGLQIDKPQIRVHDSTADHRYFVLPERPAGTEGWSKEELRTLVTRDTMVGVAVPSVLMPKTQE